MCVQYAFQLIFLMGFHGLLQSDFTQSLGRAVCFTQALLRCLECKDSGGGHCNWCGDEVEVQEVGQAAKTRAGIIVYELIMGGVFIKLMHLKGYIYTTLCCHLVTTMWGTVLWSAGFRQLHFYRLYIEWCLCWLGQASTEVLDYAFNSIYEGLIGLWELSPMIWVRALSANI